MAVVFAEVHAEVGEVFHDDDIVFVGHFANDAQFLVGEAHPSRVVGVGIEHAVDVAFAEHFFQFGAKFLAAIFVDVEVLHGDAEHLVLEFVDGEARVDEQDGVLFRVGMSANHERGKGALHGSNGRNAVGGVNVEVKEVLDETIKKSKWSKLF